MILSGNRVITEAPELKLVIEVTYYLTGVLIKKGHLDPHRGESPENASSDQGDVYVPATARRSPGAGGEA